MAYLAARGGGYDSIVRHEAGLVIWSGLALGFAFGILPRARLTWVDQLPLVAAALLGLLTLFSLTSTPSDERTVDELSRLAFYAGVVAIPLYALNRFTWRAAAAGVATAAIAICGLAVATRLAPGPFPTDDVAVLFNSDRLSYPLDYWNAVAAWGTIAATMALSYSAHLKAPLWRAAALGAVPLATTCVYLTYSRAGAIGIAIGLISVLTLSRNRLTAAVHAAAGAVAGAVVILAIRGEPAIAQGTGGDGGSLVAAVLVLAALACAALAVVTSKAELDRMRLNRWIAHRGAPIAAAVAVALALAMGGVGALSDAWDEFRNQETVSVAQDDPAQRLTTAAGTRNEAWSTALDAFADEPVGGIGPGTFEFYWGEHAAVQEFARDAHSLYLEELAELGLPGLLLLLGFVVGGLVLAIRAVVDLERSAERAAGVAMASGAIVFVIHAGVDWMWELTAVTALGLVAISVAMAARSERDPHRRMSAVGRIGAVAVSLVVALIQIPGLVSTARERESANALEAGRVSEARELADEAIEAEPWAATPYEARAAAEARRGDFAAARDDIERAIDREATNWRHRLALVQVELAAGNRDAARAVFEDLVDLSLTSAVPYEDLSALAEAGTVRSAALDGCLGYVFGACTATKIDVTRRRCLPPGDAASAIRSRRGTVVGRLGAVKVSIPNADPVYYVAADVDGEVATWALDVAAYRTGVGEAVPLNEPARAESTLGEPVDPAAFGLSPSDEGATAARLCLRTS